MKKLTSRALRVRALLRPGRLGSLLGHGGLGAFPGLGRALLLAGTLLRGGFLRRCVRAGFANGIGLVCGRGLYVLHWVLILSSQ